MRPQFHLTLSKHCRARIQSPGKKASLVGASASAASTRQKPKASPTRIAAESDAFYANAVEESTDMPRTCNVQSIQSPRPLDLLRKEHV